MIAAVILAAGPGTRLGTIGATMPKAMIPVAGRPYIEHLTVLLLDADLRPVVVGVHHRAEQICNHFGRDPRWADMTFVFTDQRGTGADLIDCMRRVPTDACVVWNGDTMVDLDLPSLLAFYEDDPYRSVIVLTRRGGVPNEGAFFVDDDGTVLASAEAVPAPIIPGSFAWRGSSTGVLVLRRSHLGRFYSTSPPSLEETILPVLIRERRLRAFDNGTRYFLDFGTPDRLERLTADEATIARLLSRVGSTTA